MTIKTKEKDLLPVLHQFCIDIYCTLCGQIKGAASAISVIQHSLRRGAHNTAQHMIAVIVLAFLTQENEAGKMQSTINQLKHGKGRAVHDNGTRGVVSYHYCMYSTSFHALTITVIFPVFAVRILGILMYRFQIS